MSVPRDLSGTEFAAVLSRLGYVVTRQKGSHMRLTTQRGGEHHVTIPLHRPLRIGTVASILKEIADHFGIKREALERQLF